MERRRKLIQWQGDAAPNKKPS